MDRHEALLLVSITHRVITSEGRFRSVGSASGSRPTSGSASGSRKSPECIFIQRSWYRVVRDAFGVPEVLPEVLPDFRKCFRKSEVTKIHLSNVFVVE